MTTTMMDNYPPGFFTSCAGYGTNGDCGRDCPLYIAGNCPIEDEMLEALGDDDDDDE